MAVEMKRVFDALNPEGLGGAAVLAANVVAAVQDGKSAETGWMGEKYQMAVQLAAIGGGGYMIAANKAPQWGLGIFATGVVIVGANIAKRVYDKIEDRVDPAYTPLALISTGRKYAPQSVSNFKPQAYPQARAQINRRPQPSSAADTRILMPGQGVPAGRSAQYSTLGDRAS